MARLVWDQLGSREFETGIDRGVLYDQDMKAYAWNGLTGVVESFPEDTTSPSYNEGQKLYDQPTTGAFEASLSAYTYPDKFLEFEGTYELEGGLYAAEQTPKTFSLSYRTLIGNDLEGTDAGYKMHVLYNLLAVPSNRSYDSLTDEVNPLEFEWSLTSVPPDAPGYIPTAHLIFDSRRINPELLWILESTFYGNEYADGRLMPLAEVIQYVKTNWS